MAKLRVCGGTIRRAGNVYLLNMANSRPPKTVGEAVQRLKLFNERLRTLRGRKFIPMMKEAGFTWTFSQDEAAYETRGPDEEARLAVVSTLRMFVQPRDGISIPQIADLYLSLPVELDPKAKESAQSAANSLQEYFAKPTGITIYDDVLTNGRLFEVFMYGDLAHSNEDKRAGYEKWMQHPAAAPVLPVFFDEIVGELLRVILSFHAMNERTIRYLETLHPEQRL
jgi:hypothetical protein